MRKSRHRGSGGGQMQKCAAENFHGVLEGAVLRHSLPAYRTYREIHGAVRIPYARLSLIFVPFFARHLNCRLRRRKWLRAL